jgi:predicted nucleotidyltransferase
VADESVRRIVVLFIEELEKNSLPVKQAVLFGSYQNGTPDKYSDIDLLVISPRFDDMKNRDDINIMWKTAANIDSRIEPIPCGVRQWQEDDFTTIIEIARREGLIITAA